MPFVVGTRPGGRVQSVDPRRPSFTRCGWRWAISAAASQTPSPFGGSEVQCAPGAGAVSGARTLQTPRGHSLRSISQVGQGLPPRG
eukprot:11160162-Lingulodinium_polyedra.AAC.1